MSVPVSGLQEAVEKAQETLRGAAEQIGMEMGDEVAWNTSRALYVLGNSLYAVIRAAQVSALESVAKEMCQFCARDIPAEIIDGDWFHGHDNLGKVEGDVRLWGWCEADKPILDALSRLRQSASAPDER